MKHKVQKQFGYKTEETPLQQIVNFTTVAEEQLKLKRAHK